MANIWPIPIVLKQLPYVMYMHQGTKSSYNICHLLKARK